MLDYIFAAVASTQGMVNKVGKYLKQHIDSAYKVRFEPQQCIVYMETYYQLPEDPDSFNVMPILLSIAAYQNKLRINITEDSPSENTIGQIILTAQDIADMSTTKKKILQGIIKCLNKEYEEFDFVF